jgi:serine/threonine-protein kinase
MKARIKELQTIHEIPGGGMANLILAENPEHKKVVIRVLKREFGVCSSNYFRFLRGARIRQRVSPNDFLVNSQGWGLQRCFARPYEVLDYVAGRNLRSLVSQDREVINANCLAILREIAAALAYLHNQEVLHLDVKPENVLIDSSQPGEIHAKLTDFDLSRQYRNNHMKEHHASGSQHYMPPEQLKNGQIGYEADVYAFGVTAYYCITGHFPFEGGSDFEYRRAQCAHGTRIKTPETYDDAISHRLSEIVMHCLSHEKNKRIPTMGCVYQELKAL